MTQLATHCQGPVREAGETVSARPNEGFDRAPLCRGLDPMAMERLEALAEPLTIGPGELLCVEGKSADHVFIVDRGVLKVYMALADGRRQIPRFLNPGDFLGSTEASPRYVWSVQAVTSARVWAFERSRFAELVRLTPTLQSRLLAVVWEELETAREHMLLLASKGAEEKIASFLLALARRQRGARGAPLSLPMTRRDIAEHLGLKTETVSRTMRGLYRRGVIALPDHGHAALLRRGVLYSLAVGRREKVA